MKTFNEYCENLRQQEDLVTNIITNLYYSEDLSPDEIAKLDIKTISDLLIQRKLNFSAIDPLRLAAMIKLKARFVDSGEQLSPSAPKDE